MLNYHLKPSYDYQVNTTPDLTILKTIHEMIEQAYLYVGKHHYFL